MLFEVMWNLEQTVETLQSHLQLAKTWQLFEMEDFNIIFL